MTRIRLQALLGASVHDAAGDEVGIVHDARFVADGPPLPSGRPSYRLNALICGPTALGNRLGYDGDVHGPWPLDRLFRFLGRHSRLIEWEQVASFDERGVQLNVGRNRLRGLHDATDGDDGARKGARTP
jgi:hypothetical protein